MSTLNSQKIAYYRDCYKEDSADINLWNVTKRSAEDQLILTEQDDLGSGEFTRLPINSEFSQHILKQLEMYQREKTLLYCSFLCVGKIELNGRVTQIVSPLIFNEASITLDQGHYFFCVNSPTHEINEDLLTLLFPEGTEIAAPATHCSTLAASQWVSYLQSSPLEMHLLDALKFPELQGLTEINKALKKAKPSLLPVSMLVLVERSASSRGTLHEIDQITQLEQLSPPLSSLLDEEFKGNTNSQHPKYDYLPGLLSKAQKKVLVNAANLSLSCVSGPPGTGKSYTIAAVAAEHMARGESVLIVANNDTALDVISDKLDETFALGEVSIRAGKKHFLKQLKSYLDDLLAGYAVNEPDTSSKEIEASLTQINKSLTKQEQHFIKFCRKAISRGQRLHKLQGHQSQWLTKLYLMITSGSIKQLAQQWHALSKINQLQQLREQTSAQYLNAAKHENLKCLLENQRQSLQAFNKAIRSRSSKRQLEYFEGIEYSALLSAFPIWLASLNSLYRVLPLQREMFDLVIIDEATQSNISRCLNAFYRAKRALVVGDTKQLRHYSFLARDKQQQLLDHHQLSIQMEGISSYRDHSILDLSLERLNSDQQIVLLDEHFRSRPELIHFSNQAFYRNQLKIMQHRPCTDSGHLHLVRVNGTRDSKGVNLLEAQHVIDKIAQLIKENTDMPSPHSIGVVSPFRHQAEYINALIIDNFTQEDIRQHKLLAATPFGFQGEERDLMLISFALDNDSKRAASYLDKADVFNVCITRAKLQQWIFLSIDEQQLATTSLLRSYIESISTFQAQHAFSSHIDEFQSEIREALTQRCIETWLGYQVAGTDIDILCRKDNTYLAIDLIGYPGPWADFFEIDTYKVLQRANLPVIPISYGLWVIDRETCIDKIISELNSK